MSPPLSRTERTQAGGILALVALLAALLPGMAAALEFRSVAVERAVLYDAPSQQAKKLYTADKYYPVEVIVSLESFVKVSDHASELFWIEKNQLDTYRTVLVTVPRADIRASPDKNAPLVFQAERDVVLELVEEPRFGWAKVFHRDGQSGYVQISQVWGV
ncbi:MAG: SH3 domain-containing protein [Sulfuricellaceae bacterium]